MPKKIKILENNKLTQKEKNKGITLVALVVTIVVLIILAGVSISATLGENGIITIAKQAKENIEQAQIQEQTKLNELYTQIDIGNSGGTMDDQIADLLEFKKIIAEAITKKGIETKPTDSATTMANNIASIKTEKPTEGTATVGDILLGKTAWVNGNKLTGSMANNGAYMAKLTGNDLVYWAKMDQDLFSNIPDGYHKGSKIHIPASDLQFFENTFYGMGRTQGQNDVIGNPGAYGIRVAATSQNGTFVTGWIKDQHSYVETITFPQPFGSVPKVIVGYKEGNWNLQIQSRTAGGFTVKVTSYNYGETQCTITWNATV